MFTIRVSRESSSEAELRLRNHIRAQVSECKKEKNGSRIFKNKNLSAKIYERGAHDALNYFFGVEIVQRANPRDKSSRSPIVEDEANN